MEKMTSDTWRMIIILAVIVLVLGWYRLPALLLVVALGGLGAYLLYRGVQRWTGRFDSAPRVTYWRGRRIELEPARRRDTETVVSLVAGAVLLLISLMLLA